MKKSIYSLLIIFFLNNFNLSAQVPLAEHPRPDFHRQLWQNLNGEWDFKFDSNDKGVTEKWYKKTMTFDKRIIVPFPWGSKLSGVDDESKIAWYKRSINVSKDWKSKKTYIVVGASDWETTIWLDGNFIGSHKGGYIPFSFDLSPYLKYGRDQNLVIRVDDDTGPESNREFTLQGKQAYGNARGIWQTVYLEARGEKYFDAIHFTPDIDNEKVITTVYINEKAKIDTPFSIKIKTDNGFIEKSSIIKKGTQNKSFDVSIPEMRLWTLEDPYLYDVTASLSQDIVNTYFGMRKISIMDLPGTDIPYVALNNKPIYLQLALDQSYHPDGFYTFPSDLFIKEELLKAKSIGLNGIRIHIKVEHPRKLYWADKIGLLVQQDVPNSFGRPDINMRNETEYTLRGMIKRDYNHPSIFSWVNFNEQWGLVSIDENNEVETNIVSRFNEKEKVFPETVDWVASMYDLSKSLDPTRLIEDNSASYCCGQGFHSKTDIASWHTYVPGYEWEHHINFQIDRFLDDNSNRFFAKGYKRNNQPFVNMETGAVWGYTAEKNGGNYAAGDIDFSYDYHRMINSYRKIPFNAGWLYTQLTDVINEWNGYWRYDRTDKENGLGDIVDGMTINDFHSDIYLSTGVNITETLNGGEKYNVPLFLSSMTDREIGDNIILEFDLSHMNSIGETEKIDSGKINVNYHPWINQEIETLQIEVPNISGLSKLSLILKSLKGEILHRNFMHFEVQSNKKIKNVNVISISPEDISKSSWTSKEWLVFDNKKINGTGKGFFEYDFDLSNEIIYKNIKEAYLIFEASAKQLFVKDMDIKSGNQLFGKAWGWEEEPSESPNSYPMTDDTLFPSNIKVLINGNEKGLYNLIDDPADHRGILSWHNQITPKGPIQDDVLWEFGSASLNEAGSYGYLVKIPISIKELNESIKNGNLKLKIETIGEGGLAIYGKSFGRYPFNPSIVIIK